MSAVSSMEISSGSAQAARSSDSVSTSVAGVASWASAAVGTRSMRPITQITRSESQPRAKRPGPGTPNAGSSSVRFATKLSQSVLISSKARSCPSPAPGRAPRSRRQRAGPEQ
jgi:hypothetical protein